MAGHEILARHTCECCFSISLTLWKYKSVSQLTELSVHMDFYPNL